MIFLIIQVMLPFSNTGMDVNKILKGNTSDVQHTSLQFSNKLEWEICPFVISALNYHFPWKYPVTEERIHYCSPWCMPSESLSLQNSFPKSMSKTKWCSQVLLWKVNYPPLCILFQIVYVEMEELIQKSPVLQRHGKVLPNSQSSGPCNQRSSERMMKQSNQIKVLWKNDETKYHGCPQHLFHNTY